MSYMTPTDALYETYLLWMALAAPDDGREEYYMTRSHIDIKNDAAVMLGMDYMMDYESTCPLCQYDILQVAVNMSVRGKSVRRCEHCLVWAADTVNGDATCAVGYDGWRMPVPDEAYEPGSMDHLFSRWARSPSYQLRKCYAEQLAVAAKEDYDLLVAIGYQRSRHDTGA